MGLAEKQTYSYRERDEEKRRLFIQELQSYKPENIVYVDESGIDNRDDYGYGWNEIGKRFHDFKSGKRSLRVSMVSSLCQGSLIATLTFEGSCNRQLFEKWLAEMLGSSLKPGQTVIIDKMRLFLSRKRFHSCWQKRHVKFDIYRPTHQI